MAEAARQQSPIFSVEEYLDFEEASGTRHEFVNGIVYAMVGARDVHNLIAGNLFALLWGRLRDGCEAFAGDTKLRIRSEWEESFYYPDVFVSCSAADREPYWRQEPAMIAEVLSPSTERIDRTEKFTAYKSIPSLQDYLLLSQDRMRAELFRRRTGWEREVVVTGELALESVAVSLPLADLYRRPDLAAG